MDFVLIKQETPEWEFIWNFVETHPVNEGLEEPSVVLNEGHSWEYTGSFREGNKLIHSIRHKNHPKMNGMINYSFHASDSFSEDQIQVSKKIQK